jgi:23S rRNA (cytosine1962-C5)-methyltransferase
VHGRPLGRDRAARALGLRTLGHLARPCKHNTNNTRYWKLMTTEATETLRTSLSAAFEARSSLLERLHGEQTDAYRLYHGTTEGTPGLTIDRYNELLLVQSFHQSLDEAALATIKNFYLAHFPALIPVYNDRSKGHSRITNTLPEEELAAALKPHVAHEMGVSYAIQGRHGGQDPWLFLDLRAGRRRVMAEAAGKSVLNLFAYTCGVGIAAASSRCEKRTQYRLRRHQPVRRQGKRAPQYAAVRPRFVKSDAFAAMRQLSGIGQAAVVRGRRLPPFPKLEPQQFDLVFLDPPRYAKSPFGVVDLVNDYAALFKPALLSTAVGGTLICCNNVAEVDREAWLDQLERSARKASRPIREMEWIQPEADFPSPDGKPPLKIALLRV